jgi:hypothetical protein
MAVAGMPPDSQLLRIMRNQSVALISVRHRSVKKPSLALDAQIRVGMVGD